MVLDPVTMKVAVDWPWAHLLAGQPQYELLMGVCWENLLEPGLLTSSVPSPAAAAAGVAAAVERGAGLTGLRRSSSEHPPVPQPHRLGSQPHIDQSQLLLAVFPHLRSDTHFCARG